MSFTGDAVIDDDLWRCISAESKLQSGSTSKGKRQVIHVDTSEPVWCANCRDSRKGKFCGTCGAKLDGTGGQRRFTHQASVRQPAPTGGRGRGGSNIQRAPGNSRPLPKPAIAGRGQMMSASGTIPSQPPPPWLVQRNKVASTTDVVRVQDKPGATSPQSNHAGPPPPIKPRGTILKNSVGGESNDANGTLGPPTVKPRSSSPGGDSISTTQFSPARGEASPRRQPRKMNPGQRWSSFSAETSRGLVSPPPLPAEVQQDNSPGRSSTPATPVLSRAPPRPAPSPPVAHTRPAYAETRSMTTSMTDVKPAPKSTSERYSYSPGRSTTDGDEWELTEENAEPFKSSTSGPSHGEGGWSSKFSTGLSSFGSTVSRYGKKAGGGAASFTKKAGTVIKGSISEDKEAEERRSRESKMFFAGTPTNAFSAKTDSSSELELESVDPDKEKRLQELASIFGTQPSSGSGVGGGSGPELSRSGSGMGESRGDLTRSSDGLSHYNRLVEMAATENFDDLEREKFLYISGRDMCNRPIIVIITGLIPKERVDMAKLLLYFIHKLDPIVMEHYVLVICTSGQSSQNRPNFSWMKRLYNIFKRNYKKNVMGVYIVHPTTSMKMFFLSFRPFLKRNFYRKLHYITDVQDLLRDRNFSNRSLELPDSVIRYKQPKRQVFGAPLDEVITSGAAGIVLPAVLEKTMSHLVTKVELEGIFRISGNKAEVERLRTRFNDGDESIDLEEFDPFAVGSLLKLYLRELPEPIMTFSLYSDFLALEDNFGDDAAAWVPAARDLVKKLPDANRLVLVKLLNLLGMIVGMSEVNKMTASNISIVFGPNLIRSATVDPMEAMEDAPRVNRCVCHMVEHFKSFQDCV